MQRSALLFLLIVSIVLNGVLTVLFFNAQKGQTSIGEGSDRFSLLSPQVSGLNAEDFLELQDQLILTYAPLKESFREIVFNDEVEGEFAVYFEDLNTGAWVGVNEKTVFPLASLFKIPTLAAVLKKVEQGDLSLSQKVVLEESDLDDGFGELYSRGAGYETTLQKIVEVLLKESDNTALSVLERMVQKSDVVTARFGMGVPLILQQTPSETGENFSTKDVVGLSPKAYSNVFRSLYYSTYLRRVHSQLVLSLLTDSIFKDGIPAGVGPGVGVAHKIGSWEATDSFHDCGIVYVSRNSYILCVMSQGSYEEEAHRVTRLISEAAYRFVAGSGE